MRATYRYNTTKTSRMLEAVRTSLRFGWATLPMIAAYVVVVSTTFLWYEPAPIAHYYRTVSKLDVTPGEEVVISATVTRSKGNCDSIVTRTWTDDDGELIAKTIYPVEVRPAGTAIRARPAIIPFEAPVGSVWLRTEVEYICNPVQRWLGGTHFPLPDILFNVHPRATGDVPPQLGKTFAGSYP